MGAAEDLSTARTEIESRLRPDVPDLSLVCDRGLVHELQGNHAAAMADLELARKSGADFWMLMPLEALAGSPASIPGGNPPKVQLPNPAPSEPRNGKVTEKGNNLPNP